MIPRSVFRGAILALLFVSILGGGYVAHAQSSGVCSAPSITRTLTPGSSGADVTALQNFLASQGVFFSTPTGYFGSITQGAVQQWQANQGLVTTGTPATTGFGIVGPRTRIAMMQGCTGMSSASTASTGATSAFVNPTTGGLVRPTVTGSIGIPTTGFVRPGMTTGVTGTIGSIISGGSAIPTMGPSGGSSTSLNQALSNIDAQLNNLNTNLSGQ